MSCLPDIWYLNKKISYRSAVYNYPYYFIKMSTTGAQAFPVDGNTIEEQAITLYPSPPVDYIGSCRNRETDRVVLKCMYLYLRINSKYASVTALTQWPNQTYISMS
jgi:hypothetical protein